MFLICSDRLEYGLDYREIVVQFLEKARDILLLRMSQMTRAFTQPHIQFCKVVEFPQEKAAVV